MPRLTAIVKNPLISRLDILEWVLLVAVGLALVVHFRMATLGWDHSVGGPHDFRQSQTAIAAWYFLQEGPELDYKIPVLGPQWRLPHELPVYQAVVAGWSRITGMPLEPSGRLISLLSFYGCLLSLVGLLRTLKQERLVILGALLLILSTATYIFYSRTFLIEPMALLLSLLFVWGAMRILYRDASARWSDLWLVPVTILAATIKLTTFSVSFGLVLMLTGLRLLDWKSLKHAAGWRSRGLALGGLLLLGMLSAVAWNKFVLYSWSLSPQYADAHLGMHGWNFGELMLRNRSEYWGRIFRHMLALPFGSALIAFVGLAGFAFAPRPQRLLAFAFLAAWFSGFLVWGNLYYVHDYYGYASAIFFVCWVTISLNGARRAFPALRWPAAILFMIFAIGQFTHYRETLYYGSQVDDWGAGKRAFAMALREQVAPEEVLLIFGEDWSPFIPYYAQRYANMVRWEGYWAGGRYAESLEMMRAENRHFGGVVVRNDPVWIADFAAFCKHYDLHVGEPQPFGSQEFTFYKVIRQFP